MGKNISFLGTILVLTIPGIGICDYFSAPTGELVPHPVTTNFYSRSQGVWRDQVGRWGESFTHELLKLRGFTEIHEIKNTKGNGIDRIAIKRFPDGRIMDLKFVEVKTNRAPSLKLNQTRTTGLQMSRSWLAGHLNHIRNSPDPSVRKLGHEILKFIRTSKSPIDSFGEVVHINTKTGKMTAYKPDGKSIKYSENIDRLMKKLSTRTTSPETQIWANREIRKLRRVQQTGMTTWLGADLVSEQKRKVLQDNYRMPSEQLVIDGPVMKPRRMLTKILRRALQVYFVFETGMDFHEIYSEAKAGKISSLERNKRIVSTLVGLGGGLLGAVGGAEAGAFIGAFGGPLAWATVPGGALIGGVVGGIGGHFFASQVFESGFQFWYDSLDKKLKVKFETEWLAKRGWRP